MHCKFMSCIFMPCYLVRKFHVLQFHVWHFQSTRLNTPVCCYQPSCYRLSTVKPFRLPPPRSGTHCLTVSFQHNLSTRFGISWRFFCSGDLSVGRLRWSFKSSLLRSPRKVSDWLIAQFPVPCLCKDLHLLYWIGVCNTVRSACILCSNSQYDCRSVGLSVDSVTGSASPSACSCPAVSLHLRGASWTWTRQPVVTAASSTRATTVTSISRSRLFSWCTSSTWSSAGTADCAPNSMTESTRLPSMSWFGDWPTPRRLFGGEPSVIITCVAVAKWHATATVMPFRRRRFVHICNHFTNGVWLHGAAVRAIDSRSAGPGFRSHPLRRRISAWTTAYSDNAV